MIKYSIVVFVLLLERVHSACDNQCSGHGTCMIDDVCKCYDNFGVGLSYQSGDCSDRICPFEVAWVDNPSKSGAFHKYSECAGRGICDRTTGLCSCFDGYEGKACQRASCPNDCSGHGTCEYIEELTYAATWNDFTNKYFNDEAKTFPYPYWDAQKTRGCVCDPQYGDVDCSKRMCPYGTDVLDTRDDLLVSAKFQVQSLSFVAGDSAGYTSLQSKTFALTFTSRLNETFTTIPIVFDGENIDDFANDIQLALLTLPNKVIDGVSAIASVVNSMEINVNITFTGQSVQGPQHLLIVENYECSAGCTPKITGLNLETRRNALSSNITEVQLSDYHSYECGRRGKCDYNTGLCSCFQGYTGENCNTLTTLV
jgi:hypothetical protein